MNRYSKLNVIITGLVFLYTQVLSGCAVLNPGFKPGLPSYYNPVIAHQSTVKEVQGGLELSVEEFVSANKSRQVFDADVGSYGILALGIRVENKSTENYGVQKKEIKAFLNKQPLFLLSGTQAAGQVTTTEYRKALTKDIIAAPFAIGGAIFILAYSLFMVIFTGRPGPTQGGYPPTSGEYGCWTAVCIVNNEVELHFERLALADALVKPNEAKAGFVYFKLPDKVKRLEGVTIEMNASDEKSGKRLTYKLSLPAMDLR